MPSDELRGVALVTGGGRGIGASIARELATAGMRVAVTGRTKEQVETVAAEIGGLALVGDVSHRADVEEWVGRAEAELGSIDLLVANAGISARERVAAPWTPPELAPQLVRVLASGRADALAGRYLHAEHDDVEELIDRADELREHDLNAIRLRR
ncbi:hypothetical protein BH09ACT13_BH09ACT13_05190 [soil metagenome]